MPCLTVTDTSIHPVSRGQQTPKRTTGLGSAIICRPANGLHHPPWMSNARRTPNQVIAGSGAHLFAVGMDRAAGGDRAGAAAGVHPGLEDGPGHPGRDGLHQVLGPAWLLILGQRALPLHLGAQRHPGRLADLDELRATRLGQAEPLEGAEQHRQLVDAELRVPTELVLVRRAAAGLQVDDDRPTRLVGFQPVHPAGDLDLADPNLQRLLDRDQLTRVRGMPVEEPADHALGQGALLGAIPGAPEVKMVPDFIDAISYRPFGRPGGSQHGGRVNNGAEVAQDIGSPGTDRRLEQPAQPAPGEGLDLGGGQPDRLTAGHDRAVVGQPGQRVPLARVGGADPGGGQLGQLRRRGLPDGRRAGGVGRGPAQVGDQRGHGQPPVPPVGVGDPFDGDVIAGQLGQEPGRPWSVSSPPTAVTTSRFLARVTAT